MKFSNEETAAQYEAVPGFEQDRTVSLIGKFGPKLVSNLLPAEAKDLVNNGVNYIRPLAQSTVPPAASEKKSDAVSQA